ncbi:hypothetical protein GMOD_00003322 [Pyrenophora seminiperda CCB06]|uniref:Uncharacterized protein n=1 Tax=Pyrenophora seminiperda CCB06 TaxID=1302712 RepID=A0A3M7MIW6_9PLEO|nr:hypothetical protein GMOD_00003322 [Pyrenophora seminiperda CCB06]
MNHLGDSKQIIKREARVRSGMQKAEGSRKNGGGDGADCRGEDGWQGSYDDYCNRASVSVGRSARLRAGSTADSGAKASGRWQQRCRAERGRWRC